MHQSVGDPDRHIVWRLMYRLLGALFGAAGVRFPDGEVTPAGADLC
jgi:hypothetical protein